jgi:hypothetical protein
VLENMLAILLLTIAVSYCSAFPSTKVDYSLVCATDSLLLTCAYSLPETTAMNGNWIGLRRGMTQGELNLEEEKVFVDVKYVYEAQVGRKES